MGLRQKHILITCGPTWVAIDKVRVISNCSSGQLGQRLALGLAKAGSRVTLLEGPVQQPLRHSAIKIVKFRYYDEFSGLLKAELNRKYDAVIHAAAVADYRPVKRMCLKLKSGRNRITLALVPTEKLINLIKLIQPGVFLVGFKLEVALSKKIVRREARALVHSAHCDLVVANTLEDRYQAYILDRNANILDKAGSRQELCSKLLKHLRQRL